jgi:hypothetical protein
VGVFGASVIFRRIEPDYDESATEIGGSEKIVCGMKVEHAVEVVRGEDNMYK